MMKLTWALVESGSNRRLTSVYQRPLLILIGAKSGCRAVAADTKTPCFDLLEENGKLNDSTAQTELPFLTGNQCEAVKGRELRVPLVEIPQEEGTPISLSVSTKGDGATLHFKIPFSF
jgi:hypothetical protein